MGKKSKVTVVILTFNRCKDLERCLNSLLRQTFENFEIIVVDNGSTDNTSKLLEQYAIKHIIDTTRSKGYLRNLGWRNASANIVAYIDDDAEADSLWIENILNTFEQFKDAGAIGGPAITTCKQYSLYETAQHSKLLSYIAKTYKTVILENKLFNVGSLFESGAVTIGGYLPLSTKLKNPIYVDILTTCNLAVKKKVLQETCGFDKNFIFNNEDIDLSIRIKKAGYKLVFNPNVKVWHHVNPNAKTRTSPYFMGRDFAYFYIKDIRPKTLSGDLRFLLNIFFFNMHFLYKAFQTKSVNNMVGVYGFVSGILHYLKTKDAATRSISYVNRESIP